MRDLLVQRRLSSEKITELIAALASSNNVDLSRDKRDFLAFVISQLSVRADSRAIEIMLLIKRSELPESQSVFSYVMAEPMSPEIWRRVSEIMFIAPPKGSDGSSSPQDLAQ